MATTLRRLIQASFLTAALAVGTAQAYQFPANRNTDQTDPEINELKKISSGVAKIAQRAGGALVFISVSKTIKGMEMIDPFEFFFGGRGQRRGMPQEAPKQKGLGSGFLVDMEKGYIVTNNHVIEGADEITLKLANGKTYDGEVLGRDANTDIAVVRIKDKNFEKKDLSVLSFASSQLRVGDFVVALGAPYGLEASISFGVVSAVGRGNLGITRLGNFIQTDAAINPGNSGGPLLNIEGDVVGVNSAIFSQSGGYAGIGFAVPASLVKTVGERLVSDGKVTRGYIGINMQNVEGGLREHIEFPENATGVMVTNVVKGGPADDAGLQASDVIMSINNDPIKDESDLANKIGLLSPGTSVTAKVFRDKKIREVSIKIGKFPSNEVAAQGGKEGGESFDSWGFDLANMNPSLREKFELESPYGIVVVGVSPGSVADRSGLRVGDLILTVNGHKVVDAARFNKDVSGQKKLLLRIERGGNYFYVSLRK